MSRAGRAVRSDGGSRVSLTVSPCGRWGLAHVPLGCFCAPGLPAACGSAYEPDPLVRGMLWLGVFCIFHILPLPKIYGQYIKIVKTRVPGWLSR